MPRGKRKPKEEIDDDFGSEVAEDEPATEPEDFGEVEDESEAEVADETEEEGDDDKPHAATDDDEAEEEGSETETEDEAPAPSQPPQTRDIEEYIIVAPERRRTAQIMTLAELTEAISLRTEQISAEGMGAAMIDEVPKGATTAREIAIAEMKARRCPLKIVRCVGTEVSDSGITKKYVELWSPNDMTHPPF